ncbi:unnamed protein product [Paramecium primaurelia]|uniref:Uncharacterized protein n=1 Tax=Paramecium primaurelia TaxID=5886 RepID=A0A8S1JUT2_PARPR|nr:unnamed protein product [Paramecium primaurelia]
MKILITMLQRIFLMFLWHMHLQFRIFEELLLKNTWEPLVLQALKEIPGETVMQQIQIKLKVKKLKMIQIKFM